MRWHGAERTVPEAKDLAGLAPMLIQAGDQELMLADAELLATRVQAAGVARTLAVQVARWHVFHLQAVYLASARATLRTMVGFVHAHANAHASALPQPAAADAPERPSAAVTA